MAVPVVPNGIPTLQEMQRWYSTVAIAHWNIDTALGSGDVNFATAGPDSFPDGGRFPRAVQVDTGGTEGTVVFDDLWGNTSTRTLTTGELLQVCVTKIYDTSTAVGICVLY